MKAIVILFILIISIQAINVLHLTDIHYDKAYSVGSPNNCYEQSLIGLRCCRNYSIPKEPWAPARKMGELLCDTPYTLINETLYYISSNFDIDMILWTGDSSDHHFFHQSPTNVLQEISDMTELIYFYFPKSKVIPSLGNHDTFFLDQNNPFLLPEIYSFWKRWVPEEFLLNDGSYTVTHFNITFVVINSLVIDENNIFNTSIYVDSLYSFLGNHSNPKVWVTGHIPPGSNEAGYNFTDFFSSLSYNTSFWGHTHYELIRLNRKGMVAYVCPSVLPDQHYPEFRIYQIDPETPRVVNYQDYMRSGLDDDDTYGFLYDAVIDYDLQDLEYASWINFSENIQKNQTLLDRYYSNTGPPFLNDTCNSGCLKGLLEDIFF